MSQPLNRRLVTEASVSLTSKARLLEVSRGRRSPLLMGAPALAANPPAVQNTQGYGASNLAIAAGGTGYAVGDTITLTGGTFTFATILGVSAVSAGVITGVYIVRPGVYPALPTNPTAQGSTSGVGTGATFTMTYGGGSGSSVTNFGTANVIGSTDARIRFLGYGPANINSSGFFGNSVAIGTECVFEWCTDAASFDVTILGFNSAYELYVDGALISEAPITTNSSGYTYVLTITNTTAAARTYRLLGVNAAVGQLNLPGNASVWKPNQAKRPLAYALGDSYTYGTGAYSAARTHTQVMCDIIGLDLLANGVGGTGWNTTGVNSPVNRITTQLNILTEIPDVVFLDLGYNDAGGAMSTVTTAINSAVAAIRSQYPNARIIAFGPATPLGDSTNLTAVRTTVSQACAALGITFVDVSGWITSSNGAGAYTGADNTHPTGPGHVYLGGRRAQVVSTLI